MYVGGIEIYVGGIEMYLGGRDWNARYDMTDREMLYDTECPGSCEDTECVRCSNSNQFKVVTCETPDTSKGTNQDFKLYKNEWKNY